MIYKNINEIDKSKLHTIILDLDNCLFDSRELGGYVPACKYDRAGWDEFQNHIYLAEPNCEMISWIRGIVQEYDSNLEILFITSRENVGNMLYTTIGQITNAFEIFGCSISKTKLFMRQYKDYRPAEDVKREILEQYILKNHKIDLAIDDHLANIQMYSEFKIDCLHYTKFSV